MKCPWWWGREWGGEELAVLGLCLPQALLLGKERVRGEAVAVGRWEGLEKERQEERITYKCWSKIIKGGLRSKTTWGVEAGKVRADRLRRNGKKGGWERWAGGGWLEDCSRNLVTEEPNREQTLRNHVITTPIETMVGHTVKSMLSVWTSLSLSSASIKSVLVLAELEANIFFFVLPPAGG